MATLKTPATEFSIVLALWLVGSSVFAQQVAYVSPAGTKFLLYTPPGYFSSSSTYPLLLSLHSKGEVGDDLTELTSKNPEQMPSRLIYVNKWPQDLPFIVLTPQLKPDPTDPDAQWPAKYIDEVVNYVLANHRVDRNRIYVTGISRGGTGAWTYAAAYPQKVAALLPMAGRTDLAEACRLKDIPVWTFNGDGDMIVVPQYSTDIVPAINACQPAGMFKPRVNILNARDHNGWNEVYNGSSGYKIYEWLLMFRKNDTSNKKPYVKAGPDRRIQLRSAPLHIIGDFFDADGAITNVKWQQTGGSPLTLTDTQSHMLKISNLKIGLFEFELIVTDNQGLQNSDKVSLEICDAAVTPAVTGLVLFNGKTDAAIRNLVEGDVIDMATLGLSEINVRANVTSNTASVKFTINNDEGTRSQNVGPYFVKNQTAAPEWKVTNGVYLICATPYAKPYSGGIPGLSQCFKVTVTNAPSQFCPGAGKIRQEFWSGIAGTNIASIPLQTPPTFINNLTQLEGPVNNLADNYGSRIRGYVCPPTSGIYTFWISGDDRTELWLSTSDRPADKVKIASAAGATGRRQWTKFASQKSAGIRLIANQRYYIEALHKEATGADHVSVGWNSPAGALERPIPWFRLMPYEASAAPSVSITSPADGQTYIAPASINVTATASDPDGSIKKLEFYNGSIKLGEDFTAPYGLLWNNVAGGNYKVQVKAIADDDAVATASVNISVAVDVACPGTGTITHEIWNGVTGTMVSLIPVTRLPDATRSLTIFESPTNTGDNFGARIRGYICAPLSGNYIFWISGDDHTELWLSTDQNPSNKRKVAYEYGWTTPRQWTKYASQQSAPIPLAANQKYYVEVLHKEAAGGDHVAVGWQLPNGVLERPIAGRRLSPFQMQSMALFGDVAIEDSGKMVMNDDKTLDVFPNPLPQDVSELTIRKYGGVTGTHETTIEIATLIGQVIHTEKIKCGFDCHGFSLVVNKKFAPGIYLVHVITNGESRVKRLVVK